VVNTWNSLPNWVVSANTTNTFKQGRRQVQQTGWTMGGVWKSMFWHILSKLVWRLPRCNSLRFWCVHTVANWFYYRSWL